MIPHGTVSGYAYHGCRDACPASPTCTEAHRVYHRARYQDAKNGGRLVDGEFARRRLWNMRRLGLTWREIGERIGTSGRHAQTIAEGDIEKVRRVTHERIVAADLPVRSPRIVTSRDVLRGLVDRSWSSEAACRGHGELFYPEGCGPGAHTRYDMAKEFCARCPVRSECLDHALQTGEEHGVWGGLSPHEREQLSPNFAAVTTARRCAGCGAEFDVEISDFRSRVPVHCSDNCRKTKDRVKWRPGLDWGETNWFDPDESTGFENPQRVAS